MTHPDAKFWACIGPDHSLVITVALSRLSAMLAFYHEGMTENCHVVEINEREFMHLVDSDYVGVV